MASTTLMLYRKRARKCTSPRIELTDYIYEPLSTHSSIKISKNRSQSQWWMDILLPIQPWPCTTLTRKEPGLFSREEYSGEGGVLKTEEPLGILWRGAFGTQRLFSYMYRENGCYVRIICALFCISCLNATYTRLILPQAKASYAPRHIFIEC